ncbi:helix-turn-helix domain-containing protein [Qipengyuania sp. YG27]|uniref:Helix-turn-helix domain-containing protein n=1 Tax=Qipengyuania mesophila TaxID=2867246 RepID=A0ABS7JVM4_9SPHN|nr:helix-turn-helix transcriptional regulator [Qipengyuania mesophila]MBX7501706.1 helix-turn-helix domain-containing protein [Qipengyuania mesophila]
MAKLQVQFGNLVAAHRRRRGLTQAALAESCDLSEDMIARVEAGGTGASFKTIEKIADALGVSAAALFDDTIGFADSDYPELAVLRSRLAKLSATDLRWLIGIMEAILTPKR